MLVSLICDLLGLSAEVFDVTAPAQIVHLIDRLIDSFITLKLIVLFACRLFSVAVSLQQPKSICVRRSNYLYNANVLIWNTVVKYTSVM